MSNIKEFIQSTTNIVDLEPNEILDLFIQQGFITSRRDGMLFLMEQLVHTESDPATEFPISYSESSTAETLVQFVPAEGPQLTDDLIASTGGHLDQIEGQISMDEIPYNG